MSLYYRLSKQLTDVKSKIDLKTTELMSKETNLDSLLPKLNKIIEVRLQQQQFLYTTTPLFITDSYKLVLKYKPWSRLIFDVLLCV